MSMIKVIIIYSKVWLLFQYLHLQDFMLYAHGPDLCHESDLKHAMANCFEALMGMFNHCMLCVCVLEYYE